MSQEFDLSQGSQCSSQGGGAHTRRDDASEYRSGGDSSDTGGDAWDDDGGAAVAAGVGGGGGGAALDGDDGDTAVMRRGSHSRSTAASSTSSPRHRSRRSGGGGHPHPAPPPVVRYEDDQRQSKLREITLPGVGGGEGGGGSNGAAVAATAASPYGRASPAIATRIAPSARGGSSPALSVAPSSAPLLAARAALASPAPSAGGGGGGFSTVAPSPHLGVSSSATGAPKLSAIQKALLAAKTAQPPPLPPPPRQASPSPPAVAIAAGFADGSELQQSARPDMDMASPEMPAEFPALGASPAIGESQGAAALTGVASVRPILPVGLYPSQSSLGELTQYSQQSSAAGRPRISAKSLLVPGAIPITMPFAAENAPIAMLDSGGHSSHSHKKDKHSSKKHSKKSKSHKDKKDKHKRSHSASSSSSSNGGGVSGAEGEEKQRKHKKSKHKHDKEKEKRKHKSSSSGVAQAAAIPGSSRVKPEPGAPAGAPLSRSAQAASASSLSRSPPDYPATDADFFSSQLPSRLAASVQSAAVTASLQAKSRASRTKYLQSKETNLRDLAKVKTKGALSDMLKATLSPELRPERPERIDDDVEPLPWIALAGAPHARLTLSSATTPPRRQRVTDLLSSKIGDQEDDDQAGAESWSGGGGGSGSGDKRRKGRAAKLGPLEQKLANLLATRNSSKRMKHQQHISWTAANVLTGLPSPHNPDADSLIVRVLVAQLRFNVKFLLVSLCSPDVRTEHTIALQSLMSPVSVLPSSVSEVCRAVARASGLPYAAVPSSLLRIVMLPPSEHVEEGETASGHHEKLGDFPNCFLRLRQPFTYYRPDGCIPTIVNVRDWSRLLGPNQEFAMQSEQQTWKEEQIRTDDLMKAERALDEVFDSVGGGGSRKNNAESRASAMEDVVRAASELQDTSGGLMTDLLGPNPAVSHAASALESLSLDQAERVLDINEREWPIQDLIFHPSLRPDQHHELLQQKQADRMPLATLKPFSNPVEMLVVGIVQKTAWRGVNIAPNVDSVSKPVEGETEAPAAKFSKIELPSFFVQDASGGVVEVEVPLALLPQWGPLLARGLGGFVQLLQLRQSSSWRATHSSDSMESMQRSFQPWARDAGTFERRDIVLLTVTEESSFRTSTPTMGAPLSMHVRRNSINVTPLLQTAKISSVAAAKRLDRVTLVGRVIHLENHAQSLWKLYLTDESLKGSALTSTMLIELRESFHHAIFDTFLSVAGHTLSGATTLKFVDVAVGFDRNLRVPTLMADEFTDVVNLTRAPKENSSAATLEQQEPQEILALRRASKPIRRLNPFTRRLMMLPQHFHRGLSVDRAVEMPLMRLLQQGHIVMPLVQKHAIFVFEATIGIITTIPAVVPRCQHCSNLFPRNSSRSLTPRRECVHCHQVTEILPADIRCWLHWLQVPVLIDEVRAMAQDESTLPRITMQIESEELQTLTNAWEEGDKREAFLKVKKMNELLGGRSLPKMFPSLCSPITNKGSPLSLLSPSTAAALAFQVATHPAHMQDEMAAAAYSQSQEWTGSQMSQGSNVNASATQSHTQYEEVDM